MLAIRMQRTGRKGHAMFRVVVQDSRLTPTSGRVVAQLGSYDPHAKTSTLVKDKAEYYLSNGAQPSPRVVRLMESEGVTLPSWVKTSSTEKTKTTRHADKLRKNQQKAEDKTADKLQDELQDKPEDAVVAEATPTEDTPVQA